MKLKDIVYLDATLNALFVVMLLGLCSYSIGEPEGLVGYLFWWSLKIPLVLMALCTGLLVKDFWHTVLVLTFALAVYSLVMIFEQMREGFYFQFFSITYIIFLGFISIGNVTNKFISWVLHNGESDMKFLDIKLSASEERVNDPI